MNGYWSAVRATTVFAFALAISGTVPVAKAASITYDFTANNTTHLFNAPSPYSLFGTFTYDYSTGLSTADFWVQAPNATNGEFKTSAPLTLGSNQIRGFDITNNNILLTFRAHFPSQAVLSIR